MAAEAVSCSKLPTLELGELGVQHTEEPSQQEWERVTRQLEHVLSETGCAYLTQHGLPGDLVNDAISSGVAFFELRTDAKMRWTQGGGLTGYLKNNDDNYSSESYDLKESFLFRPESYSFLNNEPPPFKTAVTPLYDLVHTLSKRLMTSLSLSLGKPRDYFAKMHTDGCSESVYRFNYYPGSTKGRKDVVGFGAHIDFTTFSLLLSNDTGGFQVKDSAGMWMDVPVVPGTVLLMAGEFLNFYSNKRFKAPMHRVVLSNDERQGCSPRCSLIFFLHADAHIPMWLPSNDPASPPPPTVEEYLQEQIRLAREASRKY